MEDFPAKLVGTYLASEDTNVILRCIIVAQKIREDPEVDLSPYCMPKLTDPSLLPEGILLRFLSFF